MLQNLPPKVDYKSGYFQTDIHIDSSPLKKVFEKFMSRPLSVRKKYSQEHFDYGFDGYSFLGMPNSTNQYASDLLHSFVLSELNDRALFPEEFQTFLKSYWDDLTNIIFNIEQAIIFQLPKKFRSPILNFHKEHMGYCASLNYYPKIKKREHNTRLSQHKDVSLISVFPFGIDEGLQIEMANDQWITVEPTKKAFAFTGYLCQLLTNNQVKASNHRVLFNPHNESKRYSYVFFSLPRPNVQIPVIDCSSKDYFKSYLKLF